MIEYYRGYCEEYLKIKKIIEKGYVIFIKFFGDGFCDYIFLWFFFFYLLNKEYLVNMRVNYLFFCSGILLFYYVRFVDGVGIGKIFK